MRQVRSWAAVLAVAASCHTAMGRTIHVPGDFATIQGAIDDVATVDGDEVVVAAGTYYENINFFGKAITLRCTDPNNPHVVSATIIDGGWLDSTVSCNSGEGPGTVLQGFTITHGMASAGGGLFNFLSSPTVIGCIFIDNAAEFGGGVSANVSSDPTIINCRFLGNTADQGGGVYVSSSSNPTFANCTFSGNEGGQGGGMIVCGGAPTMVNCTLAGNVAPAGGGGVFVCEGGPVIANSIVWGNTPDQVSELTPVTVITHSDVQGGFKGAGNVNADPLFVFANGPDGTPGTDDDNLGLSTESPCIDAADNTAVPADVADLDGDGDSSEALPLDVGANPRFVDGPRVDTGVPDGLHPIVDMGAEEFGATGCPADCGNGNGMVDVFDFLALLSQWGQLGSCDMDGGGVGLNDFLDLLAAWGPCP